MSANRAPCDVDSQIKQAHSVEVLTVVQPQRLERGVVARDELGDQVIVYADVIVNGVQLRELAIIITPKPSIDLRLPKCATLTDDRLRRYITQRIMAEYARILAKRPAGEA